MDWISVEDKLPSVNKPVLTSSVSQTGQRYGLRIGWRDCVQSNGSWLWRCMGTSVGKVTHWMPLPEPPKEKFNEEDCKILGKKYHILTKDVPTGMRTTIEVYAKSIKKAIKKVHEKYPYKAVLEAEKVEYDSNN